MNCTPFYTKTLAKTIEFSGIGIHSGKTVCLRCIPSDDLNKGLYVVRTDQDNQELRICVENFSNTHRASIFSNGMTEFHTPEHLLSACHGLGITHARFEIDGAECPILDGSSKDFVNGFLNSGFRIFKNHVRPITLKKPILIKDQKSYMMAVPDTAFKISYILDYPHHFISQQAFYFDVYHDNYAEMIAPARTYGFYEEIKELYAQNLAKGGSLDNAVVIGKEDYMNELRFSDELVRHKILDIIGDLWVLQRPLHMHIFAVTSGHAANKTLAKKLQLLI